VKRLRSSADALAVFAFLGVLLMVLQHEVAWIANTEVQYDARFCPVGTSNVFALSDAELGEIRAAQSAAAAGASLSNASAALAATQLCDPRQRANIWPITQELTTVEVLRGLISFSTFLALLALLRLYSAMLAFDQSRGLVPQRTTLPASPLRGALLLEALLLLLHVFPGCTSSVFGSGPDLYIALCAAMFARLWLALRVIRYHSRLNSSDGRFIGSLTNVEFDTPFILKTVLKDAPLPFLTVSLALLLMVTAYALRLIETLTCAHYTALQCEPLTLLDALWLLVVTVLTVGYGDVVPSTVGGRAVAIVGGLTGTLITAVTIALTTEYLQMTRSESKVVAFLGKHSMRQRLRTGAARVIQHAFRASRLPAALEDASSPTTAPEVAVALLLDCLGEAARRKASVMGGRGGAAHAGPPLDLLMRIDTLPFVEQARALKGAPAAQVSPLDTGKGGRNTPSASSRQLLTARGGAQGLGNPPTVTLTAAPAQLQRALKPLIELQNPPALPGADGRGSQNAAEVASLGPSQLREAKWGAPRHSGRDPLAQLGGAPAWAHVSSSRSAQSAASRSSEQGQQAHAAQERGGQEWRCATAVASSSAPVSAGAARSGLLASWVSLLAASAGGGSVATQGASISPLDYARGGLRLGLRGGVLRRRALGCRGVCCGLGGWCEGPAAPPPVGALRDANSSALAAVSSAVAAFSAGASSGSASMFNALLAAVSGAAGVSPADAAGFVAALSGGGAVPPPHVVFQVQHVEASLSGRQLRLTLADTPLLPLADMLGGARSEANMRSSIAHTAVHLPQGVLLDDGVDSVRAGGVSLQEGAPLAFSVPLLSALDQAAPGDTSNAQAPKQLAGKVRSWLSRGSVGGGDKTPPKLSQSNSSKWGGVHSGAQSAAGGGEVGDTGGESAPVPCSATHSDSIVVCADARAVLRQVGWWGQWGLWWRMRLLRAARREASAELFQTLRGFRSLRRAAGNFDGSDPTDRQLTLLEALEVNVDELREGVAGVAGLLKGLKTWTPEGAAGAGVSAVAPHTAESSPGGGGGGGSGGGALDTVPNSVLAQLVASRRASLSDAGGTGSAAAPSAPAAVTHSASGGAHSTPAVDPIAAEGAGGAPPSRSRSPRMIFGDVDQASSTTRRSPARRSSVAVALRRAKSQLLDGLAPDTLEAGGENEDEAPGELMSPGGGFASSDDGEGGGGSPRAAAPVRTRRLTRVNLGSSSATLDGRRTSSVGADGATGSSDMSALLGAVAALGAQVAAMQKDVSAGMAAMARRIDALEAASSNAAASRKGI